jgi:signal transduction histidine kinase
MPGKMVFEKSLSSWLHQSLPCFICLKQEIQEKNLVLIKEYDDRIPIVLEGDPLRLHQIIMNLVSNAVKFTSQGTITVSVRMISEDDEKVNIRFSVSDTGIGIAGDRLGKIFENFQQASSSTSRLYGGTGLGLAIVKQLVESQGGSLSVTSKPNEGSIFSFTLIFSKTDSEAALDSELLELNTEIKDIKAWLWKIFLSISC